MFQKWIICFVQVKKKYKLQKPPKLDLLRVHNKSVESTELDEAHSNRSSRSRSNSNLDEIEHLLFDSVLADIYENMLSLLNLYKRTKSPLPLNNGRNDVEEMVEFPLYYLN